MASGEKTIKLSSQLHFGKNVYQVDQWTCVMRVIFMCHVMLDPSVN
jgi:hypothetical protein